MTETVEKEYALYSKAYFLMFVWLLPAILLIMSAVFFYVAVTHPGPGSPPVVVSAFPIALAAWFLWLYARMPQRIVRHADGRIEFVGPFQRLVLMPREIISIRPDRGHIGFLVLKHEAGTLRFLNQFNGFHELLSYLESVNPAVELHGC